jgi:hypothetical protein
MLALGIDGWHYLSTANRTDQLLLGHLVERAAELRRDDHEALAAAIVNTYGKAIR